MANLLRRLLARNRDFLIACAALLAFFQFILCAIVASMDIAGTFEQIIAFAPPVMRTMIEQSMLGGSTAGMLAFGWNHPITHAVMTAVAITLGARAVAGEIENGAIELVLAQPLSRARYLTAQLVFALMAILLVAFAGLAGTMIGQAVYSLHLFTMDRLAVLLINLLLLQGAFYCITLLISAFGREAGRVAAAGVLIAVVSFLIDVIGRLWNKAAFVRPLSLHKYYDPPALLMNGELADAAFLILAGVITACGGLAFWRLHTRDLP